MTDNESDYDRLRDALQCICVAKIKEALEQVGDLVIQEQPKLFFPPSYTEKERIAAFISALYSYAAHVLVATTAVQYNLDKTMTRETFERERGAFVNKTCDMIEAQMAEFVKRLSQGN